MQRIDPTTLYDAKELHEILRGVVKLETLRQYGLAGSPGSGYWGQNVVDSLNNYWDHLVRQRGTGKVIGKENHLDSKNQSRNEVQNRQVHTQPGATRTMEGQRERFRRLVSENPIQRQRSEQGRANSGTDSSQSYGDEG